MEGVRLSISQLGQVGFSCFRREANEVADWIVKQTNSNKTIRPILDSHSLIGELSVIVLQDSHFS